MTTRTYKNLAIAWTPESHEKRTFYIITLVVLALVIAVAVVVTLIDVPPRERKPREAIPERVARYVTRKQKAQPTPPPVATPTPKSQRPNRKSFEKKKRKPKSENP